MSARVRMPASYAQFCVRERHQLARSTMPALTRQREEFEQKAAAIRVKLEALQAWLKLPAAEQARAYQDGWDALRRHPDVSRVQIRGRGQTLVVWTKRIAIPYRRKLYHIGAFRIELSMPEDGRHTIRFFNRTWPVKDPDDPEFMYEHPHIASDTWGVCLGNITDTVHAAIYEQKYATAVDLLIRFLKSYNASDAEVPVTSWPVVKERRTS